MSELRTNRIVPRDGLVSGASGGIIQVVHASTQTGQTQGFSTNAFVDTGLSASITPTRSDSKILVTGYLSYYVYLSGNGSAEWNFAVCDGSNNNAVNFFRVLRGSTFIEQPSGTSSSGAGYNAHGFAYYNCNNWQDTTVIKILDSPATTSATTYKIQCAVTSGTCTINKFIGTSNYYGISTITAMEVSG